MTEQFAGLFGLYSEAVLVVSGDDIVYYNAAAKSLLPHIDEIRPVDIFPDAVLERSRENLVGELDIGGKRATYSAVPFSGYRVFSILSIDDNDDKSTGAAFAAMSAEMKNYLAVLKMAASIALPYVDNIGDEKLSKYVAMIYHSYFNILRMTGNMEMLGATSREAASLRFSSFDLIEACGEFIGTCRHLAGDKGVSLSFTSALDRLDITADRDRLEQMLLNIISNSLIYTKQGGSITLSVSLSGSSVLITVSDTGEGISDEVRPVAWSRFSEPKDLSRASEGAGFGLAAVSQIARLHGGSVFFETRAGGTLVAVSLPVKRDGPLSVNNTLEAYRSGGIQAFLTGLATAIGNDKYSQKYMD